LVNAVTSDAAIWAKCYRPPQVLEGKIPGATKRSARVRAGGVQKGPILGVAPWASTKVPTSMGPRDAPFEARGFA
jgi:hypothetical protein